MDGAPPGSIYACHQSGWIQTNIFCQWFDHITKFVKPTEAEPVILIIDGHHSHTRNIQVIEKCRSNHVAIICLPPHSTAKMQPLDVGFMKPMKTYYAQEISNWLRNCPGRVVTHYQVASLFGKAYQKATTLQISMSAFRRTGLVQCNRNIFSYIDFAIHAGGGSDSIVIPDAENLIGPADISPLPQLQKPHDHQPSTSEEPTRRKGRTGKAALITSSPYR